MAGTAEKKRLENLLAIIRKLDHLAAITSVHLRIGTIFELKMISRIYLRELIDMVGCDGCAIIRIDKDKVRILTERGLGKPFRDMEFSADQPAIKYVVDTKQTIFTGDVLSSPDASYIPHGRSVKSLICTPIMVNNHVGGIFYLDSVKKNAFNKEDMEFIELLTGEISITFDICTTFEQSTEYSRIRNIFTSDELTGCLNHRKFDLDIVTEIASAKEYGGQLSLLMIDIDWFKKYNDFHGHEKGDALLRKVVDTLASNTRPYEKIYRYGGEEFIIIMPDTDTERASSAARRLQGTIERERFEGEKKSQPNKTITVSIGVATFPSDADNKGKLIETANSALYMAKGSGGNQVCIFDSKE